MDRETIEIDFRSLGEQVLLHNLWLFKYRKTEIKMYVRRSLIHVGTTFKDSGCSCARPSLIDAVDCLYSFARTHGEVSLNITGLSNHIFGIRIGVFERVVRFPKGKFDSYFQVEELIKRNDTHNLLMLPYKLPYIAEYITVFKNGMYVYKLPNHCNLDVVCLTDRGKPSKEWLNVYEELEP